MPSWSWNCSILACCCGTEKPQVQPKHSSSPHLPIELVQASNPNPVSHTCSNPSPLHTLGNTPRVREARTALPSTPDSQWV